MEHPKVSCKLKILDERARKYLPKYHSKLASGFDLHALEDVVLGPNETVIIPTGIAIQVPQGYEIQVRPRSGMSLRTLFRVANSPATIDADYTGDLSVLGTNAGNNPTLHTIHIKAGDRIAQAVIVPVYQMIYEVVEELQATERGTSGFGSTGK